MMLSWVAWCQSKQNEFPWHPRHIRIETSGKKNASWQHKNISCGVWEVFQNSSVSLTGFYSTIWSLCISNGNPAGVSVRCLLATTEIIPVYTINSLAFLLFLFSFKKRTPSIQGNKLYHLFVVDRYVFSPYTLQFDDNTCSPQMLNNDRWVCTKKWQVEARVLLVQTTADTKEQLGKLQLVCLLQLCCSLCVFWLSTDQNVSSQRVALLCLCGYLTFSYGFPQDELD